MIKKTFKTLLGILTVLSLVFSAFFIYSIIEQYEKSVRWDSSSLLSDIHNVPPALAKNYVKGNEEELAQALTEVNNALDKIEENEGIPDGKLDSYSNLYKKAKALLQDSEIEDKHIEKPLKSLALYIQTEKTIDKAYEIVDTEDLSKYSEQIVSRLNERDNKLDKIYLNRLNTVANDYQQLENFSKRTLKRIGVIEENTLHVDLKVNKSITQEILKEISDSTLLKFSNVKRLNSMLKGDPWDDILDHHESTMRYYSWKESKDILESLLATSYKPVSDFEGLQDALDYQSNLKLEEVEGYEIDIENSTINKVYYDGRMLEDDMYIKKGIDLIFDIDYEYTRIEIEIEIIDPENGYENNEDRDKETETNRPNNNRPNNNRPNDNKKPEKKPETNPEEKPDKDSQPENKPDREDSDKEEEKEEEKDENTNKTEDEERRENANE